MEYIIQRENDSPRTRRAKSDESPKVCTTTRCLAQMPPNRKIYTFIHIYIHLKCKILIIDYLERNIHIYTQLYI